MESILYWLFKNNNIVLKNVQQYVTILVYRYLVKLRETFERPTFNKVNKI